MKVKELKKFIYDSFNDEDEVHVDVGDSIWTVNHVYGGDEGELTLVLDNEV